MLIKRDLDAVKAWLNVVEWGKEQWRFKKDTYRI